MNDIVQFIENHGNPILFVVIFVRQIGLPVPGFPFLLAAGALAATGKLHFLAVIALTVSACVLADWIWYEAGRRGGDKVLLFLHRFSHDPEFHNRRAKRTFARYGPSLLLVAKFVPGLDAVAPPLAGTLRTGRPRFLVLDAIAAGLYASVYGGLGYVFSHDLDRAVAYVSRAGRFSAGLALLGICIYVVRKIVRQRRSFRDSRPMQMAPADSYDCGVCLEMPCGSVGGQENDE